MKKFRPKIPIQGKDIPYMVFNSLDQAYEVMSCWMNKLGLQDWIIRLDIKPAHKMSDPGRVGEISCYYTERCAMLTLREYDPEDYETIDKFCHEAVLVHELLHAKMPTAGKDTGETYELGFLNSYNHQLLNDMANALIMVKYNLSKEWFKNFEERSNE